MDKVRDWLYIGALRDTRDPGLLKANGIGAVLQLAEAAPQLGIASAYLPIEDGKPLTASLLRKGLAFVAEQRNRTGA